MSQLNIFVSSTCYDLSQIRIDLCEAIQNVGHNPILSEFSDFPIDPSKNTIENCIKAIKDSADVFVLIIGNRYGFKLESGKSITNLEYITARNKGIPIYVFLSKQIIYTLPIYLRNKDSDYSTIVDNTQIFEFANEVRSISGLWNFEFEKFQDIIGILKIQLSYLFKDCLKLRDKINRNTEYDFHNKLSSKALQIILDKDTLFEHEFLAQVLIDEIHKYEMLRKDYEYKIILYTQGDVKDNKEFLDWTEVRFKEISTFIENLNNLGDVIIPKYINEPGLPSDLKGLYYSANTYARIYKSFIDWTITTLSFSVQENQIELRNALANLSSSMIESIWNYPHDMFETIQKIKQRVISGETNIEAAITLTILIADKDFKNFKQVIEKFRKSIIP